MLNMLPNRPRIMLYSHDTYGMGHLRRSLTIASQLAQDIPEATQLLITGSIIAGAFGLPERLDMIKLPALTKGGDGRYASRILPLSLAEIITWREQIILQAAVAFQPDLLLVDKSPAGVQQELLPTLRYLKDCCPNTRVVLGMRDIEDSPEATKAEWAATGVPALLDDVYDCILFYGERVVFDPLVEYDMSPAARQKLIPVGYLGNVHPVRSKEDVRAELGAEERPLVVVTVGGGGDGFALIETYLVALQTEALAPDEVQTLVVTGPLMAKGKRDSLSAAQFEHLTLLEFTHDLISYMAAADLVVSMAGYNTVREALALNSRLLLVPRTRPRAEQLIRAQRLRRCGLARFVVPDELSPQRLADEIRTSLSMPRPIVDLDFNGVQNASRIICNLLGSDVPAAWNIPTQRYVDAFASRPEG